MIEDAREWGESGKGFSPFHLMDETGVFQRKITKSGTSRGREKMEEGGENQNYGKRCIYSIRQHPDRQKDKKLNHGKRVQCAETAAAIESVVPAARLQVDKRADPAVSRSSLYDAQDIRGAYGGDACGKG